MKYRQLIFDTLKTKFEGVSDNIIGRLADKLATSADTEEAAKAAAEGVTLQRLLESYGDSRATEASQTAVKNYESKYSLKNGISVNTGGTTEGEADPAQVQQGAETIPAWAQSLIDSNKRLNEELANMKRGKITETRQAQLAEITSHLPENLRKAYARTPVDKLTDEEFETLKSDITTEVGGLQTELAAKGAVFGKPAANHGGQPGNELTQAQQEAIADGRNAARVAGHIYDGRRDCFRFYS